MADQDNRRRGRVWRESVAFLLKLAGVDGAEARQVARTGPRDAFDDTMPQPDILGLPAGWYVNTRSDISPTWGASLDATEASAHLAEFENSAIVQYRRQRPTADAFVVMTLSQFAKILAR